MQCASVTKTNQKTKQGADSAPQKTEHTSNEGQLFAALRMFLHL